MKYIHFRSIGPCDSHGVMTPEGMAIASQEGRAEAVFPYGWVFVDMTVASLKTCLAFCGPDDSPLQRQPRIPIGTLGNPALLAALHNKPAAERVLAFKPYFTNTLRAMFAMVNRNGAALAFGDPSVIMLAAEIIPNNLGEPTGWQNLNPLEGIVFSQTPKGSMKAMQILRCRATKIAA